MSTPGHNLSADRLRSFVSRIERLNEEIVGLNNDKADVFGEAKGEGFDVVALKAVIAERAKRGKNPAKFDQQQGIVELYRGIVGQGDLT